MLTQEKSLVFMGTPEFAVASLHALLNAGFRVAGVITAPDKPSGRGLQFHPSPVKKYALEHGLPVLQPEKLKDPVFLDSLRAWNPSLQVVVAFRMLPEVIWSLAPLGTFNLHASLLPQYRGAAPINWAVMNGEKETGITTFFLNHRIDEGSIIARESIPIGPDETAGDVHDRLMEKGAALVVKTVTDILAGNAKPIDQGSISTAGLLHTAPKIFKEDCRINWNRSAAEIHNFIRGLSPYPTAWCELTDQKKGIRTIKIFQAVLKNSPVTGIPGSLLSDGRNYLDVITGNGMISILQLQLEGKRTLPIADFLRGFSLEGCRFT
jgi:methionyl-tRNA formyltransferase